MTKDFPVFDRPASPTQAKLSTSPWIAAEILAKLQTATAAIQELQEMLEEGE